MAGFKIDEFKGVVPKVSPRLLATEFGQTAKNCKIGTGDLQAFKEKTLDWNPTSGDTNIQTIYKFAPGTANSDTGAPVSQGFWMAWNKDINIVDGPVTTDVSHRTYFTGDGVPKTTDNTLTLAGTTTNYPATTYDLGVPAPTNAATVSGMSGTATSSDPLDNTDVYYVYTYVTGWGEESAPSPVSGKITYQIGEQPILSTSGTAPTGAYNVTHKRFYAASTGSSSTQYQYCGEVPLATASFTDPLTRAEVLPTTGWDMPDSGMGGIVILANGILAGFKQNTLMFSEPYLPYAWPALYQLTIDHDIVGLGVSGQSLVVCTTAVPYLCTGIMPQAMSLQKMDVEQACMSKRSICTVNGTVIYASPDGLIGIDESGASLITQELFTREQWQALKPSSMHAYQHDGLYYCFYSVGSSDQGGFILDPATSHLVFIDLYATAGFNDTTDDTLYLVVSDKIYKWDSHASSSISYEWKSRLNRAPTPVTYGAAQVLSDSYPVTFKVDADSNSYTLSVPNDKPFRLPSGYSARDWEVTLTGTGTVNSVLVGDTITALGDL